MHYFLESIMSNDNQLFFIANNDNGKALLLKNNFSNPSLRIYLDEERNSETEK